MQPRSERAIVLGWGVVVQGGVVAPSLEYKSSISQRKEFMKLPGALRTVFLLLEPKHSLWITHSQEKGSFKFCIKLHLYLQDHGVLFFILF